MEGIVATVPNIKFQTLPGLLTGFFNFAQLTTGWSFASFKPFQGFLPVSSEPEQALIRVYNDGFKPFQGFLPVSSH